MRLYLEVDFDNVHQTLSLEGFDPSVADLERVVLQLEAIIKDLKVIALEASVEDSEDEAN